MASFADSGGKVVFQTRQISFAGNFAFANEFASGPLLHGIGSQASRRGSNCMKLVGIAAATFVVAVFSARCEAQSAAPYPLTEMNFDMWCQEEQHLPPDRCDKRLPEDDAAFQAYVNKIESYEIPYLQQKQHEQTLNRVILHNDPVGAPTRPSQPATEQPQGH
jgi:hypothetical protein